MLLAKNKFFIEFLISKALSNSYIDHEKCISVNNALREYNEMKKETKNPKNSVEYTMKNYWKNVVSVVRKILRTKIIGLEKLSKTD